MATMRRSLIRAGVKLNYSGGFNPHPYISSALPLSVGCGSVCELVDIGTDVSLLPDGVADIINRSLPEGIEVLEAYAPAGKFSAIKWLKITGTMYYSDKAMQGSAAQSIARNCDSHQGSITQDGTKPGIADLLAERYKAESIIIRKKTKRGVSDIDIAPHLKSVEFSNSAPVQVSAVISAQEPSLSPENLMSALAGDYSKLAPDFAEFTRIEVFDKDMQVFR